MNAPPHEILRFNSQAELCHAVAASWADLITARPASPAEPFCLALSGGRIAEPLFSSMAEEAARRSLQFAGVHFFWADERCVPPDHPESNFHLADRHLLQKLNVPTDQVHRIRGEMPPQAAAKEAEAELARVAALGSNGYPILDLVLLGMGEDGHTASLFPGPMTTTAPRPAYLHVIAPKPPPDRISLNYPCLAIAREVWVIITGPEKAGALSASLTPPAATPLGRVLDSRRATRIYVTGIDSAGQGTDI